MKLRPVTQKPKEANRIEAEQVNALSIWYDKLARLTKNLPAHLLYNFDEIGFQPGKGGNQRVISAADKSFIANPNTSENITIVECCSADGWLMPPFFIFKGANPLEDWTWDSKTLPGDSALAVSSNGWITDELALKWLDHFHEMTKSRVNKNEKRVLLFDGHGSHMTFEFLSKCEKYRIIPFGFIPHTTHLCQPLDGLPFLNYKQHFRRENNWLSLWSGSVYGKAEFLSILNRIREKALTPHIIKRAFRDRGIFPTNESKVVASLENQLPPVSDIYISDYALTGRETPPEDPTSSSIASMPPKSIEQLRKNQKKML